MGVLSAVVPSSGRFLGGGTKRGRLWVGKWAFVGWRRGVSSEAITEVARTVDQVASEFVHHMFPSFRMPCFLACPDDLHAQAVVAAIARAAGAKEVATEVIDLRPAPAELLDGVTERLCGFGGRSDR
ncbi:MAG: hypothetical protein J0L89_09470 [Xanthomonadales bacterium]|nr:hypothetical protein [Xanthomonadales bacterium]